MHSKITSQQNDLYRSHDNWSKTSSVVNAPGRSCLFAITTLEALGGSLIVEFRQALELGQNRVHLLLPFFPHLSWLSTTKITPQTSGKKLAQKGSFSKSRHKYLLFLLPLISHIENIYSLISSSEQVHAYPPSSSWLYVKHNITFKHFSYRRLSSPI